LHRLHVSGPVNGGDFSLRNYAIVFRAVRYDTIRDAVERQRAVRPAAASIPFVDALGALWRYHAFMNLRRKSILYSSTVFTARHYASAEYAVVVRPSVCILLKRRCKYRANNAARGLVVFGKHSWLLI